MITVSNLGMQFGGQWLFQQVDLQFLQHLSDSPPQHL